MLKAAGSKAAAIALAAAALIGGPFAATPAGAQATQQQQPARSRRASDVPVEEIIRRFAAAESAMRDARNNYTFKQDLTIQQIGGANTVSGTYRRVSEIVFDDQGKRVERISYFPQSTLTQLTVSQEDLNDLGLIQPFALTTEDLPKYIVNPVGRARLDELDTYVFDVLPRDSAAMAKAGQRYFTGRVWVDDQDFAIVKVAGKAGPEVKNQRYPHFETYRENIDGKYWFPTYTYADETLNFEDNSVHIRMIARYADYKEFAGSIEIVGEDPNQP